MPDGANLTYWDACVFLSYIEAEPDRVATLDQILHEVQVSHGGRKIVTSAISRVEVAYAAAERASGTLDHTVEAKIDALWADDSVLALTEFHQGIAKIARNLIRTSIASGWSLKPIDAIHLASAQWYGAAQFQTYDKRLSKYEPFTGLTICEPFVVQQQLWQASGDLP